MTLCASLKSISVSLRHIAWRHLLFGMVKAIEYLQHRPGNRQVAILAD